MTAWWDSLSFWDLLGLSLLVGFLWNVFVAAVRTLGRAWRDEPRKEWQCPSCGAVTRARMAETKEATRG